MRKRKVRYDRIVILAALLLVIPLACVFCALRARHNKPAPDADGNASYLDNYPSGNAPTYDFFTVVIDAGHGGEEDPGCISADGVRMEKDDVLSLSRLVETSLRTYQDVQVVMTRSDDTFVTLDGRCEISNSHGADLFVSIHRNSADTGNGIEAWINNTDNAADHVLAEHLLQALETVGVSENRGVSKGFRGEPESNYRVNSGTLCPSCLLEVGFLTNPTDNADFDTKKAQYADAIAAAIVQTGTELGVY